VLFQRIKFRYAFGLNREKYGESVVSGFIRHPQKTFTFSGVVCFTRVALLHRCEIVEKHKK
jgi:hypothetical protein